MRTEGPRSGTVRPLATLVVVLLVATGCSDAAPQGWGGPQSDGGRQGQQGERGRQGDAFPTTPAPGAPWSPEGRVEPDAGGRKDVEHHASGPLRDRTRARFELVSPAARVTVRTGDLGPDLYRISTPDDSGLAPAVTDTGEAVRLALTDTGGPGPDTVDIGLNQRVRWSVHLGAGAGEQRLDLATGTVSGVELSAGAAHIELRLPRPQGTVPVRMSGGAGRFDVRVPAGVPVQLRLASGAGTVSVDGAVRSGLGGGTVLTPQGWSATADRYAVEALAGVAALTVDH